MQRFCCQASKKNWGGCYKLAGVVNLGSKMSTPTVTVTALEALMIIMTIVAS